MTFPVCAFFGFEKMWLGFTAGYLLFSGRSIGKQTLWEIPMAVLSCSIITDVFADYLPEVIKVIIPVSAVIIAYKCPKKLMLFFVLSTASLIMKNVYGASLILSALWYGGREIITERQSHIYYSNIKKKLLQENNSENYIEFS